MSDRSPTETKAIIDNGTASQGQFLTEKAEGRRGGYRFCHQECQSTRKDDDRRNRHTTRSPVLIGVIIIIIIVVVPIIARQKQTALDNHGKRR